ncbi:FecR family protein [Pseudomonas synxantha]|uniref:Sigma factor regulatory protein, FecR/PupR family n=1 Tax=Pseudomonas synxantha TaxID=47883 RepID=A0AAX3I9U4_9PSED|nr:FecR family protein [Pseudomonas synxantha]AZE66333.1 Iron siderophore sensor protein [Pseudomonas synxantha]KRP51926.1 peptide ABC transporter substrate-binding protein [Pseudomonas synxantha]SDU41328.1 FecR family protein [Pseudomonas synxantha]VTR01475.1 sigma factor regulatory protein, FecR/PupR family [Pseudomonas synxantha]
MDNRVRDEAAQWFVRLQDGPLNAEERQRFDAWQSQAPEHQYEIDVLQGLWGAADLLPQARLQALCDTPGEPPKHRAVLRYAVAASVVAIAVGLGLVSGVGQSKPYSAEFSTRLGEHRQVALPDGSVMDLNSRSVAAVRYEKGQRSVELKQGEAMFSVEHDARRPFVVVAGSGQVTVTGTRFNVRRDEDQTRVAVEAGTVKVQGRISDQAVTLTAGRGTHVDTQGQVAATYAVNPEELTAWRTGKLVFNNATLGEVAREVSRYREQPLRVSTAAVGNLRLTSVFKSSDTDALLKALPHILPVALRTLPDGSQEIISR